MGCHLQSPQLPLLSETFVANCCIGQQSHGRQRDTNQIRLAKRFGSRFVS